MEFNFGEVDTIEKVPTEFRGLYVEKEGKHVVNDAFAGVAGAVMGLNKTLKTVREEAAAAKKGQVDLSPLAEFGSDPASIKAKFDERVAELVAKGGDAAKAVERVRAEMTAANKTAVDAANARTTALQNQLYGHLVTSEATSAIATAKGVAELLMPFVKERVKVTDDNGAFVVNVVDERGEIRYSGVTGQPMSIKELIAEMKADAKFGRLFESDQQQGGGGFKPGAGKATTPPAGKVLTANEKIAAGLKKQGLVR